MKDQEPYSGWLVSNSIFKRSLAVLGHYTMASVLVVGTIYLITALVAGVVAILSGGA